MFEIVDLYSSQIVSIKLSTDFCSDEDKLLSTDLSMFSFNISFISSVEIFSLPPK